MPRLSHEEFNQLRAEYDEDLTKNEIRLAKPRQGRKTAPKTSSQRVYAALEDTPLPDSGEDQEPAYRLIRRPQTYRKRDKTESKNETRPSQRPSVDPLILGLATALALTVAAGAFTVLNDVLEPVYGNPGAPLRALVPLAVEMIFGLAAKDLLQRKQYAFAITCLCVILACAYAEIDAARIAPATAHRAEQKQILAAAQDQSSGPIDLEHQDEALGKRGKLQAEQNNGKLIDLAATAAQDKTKIREQRMSLAAQTAEGEDRIPTELALLGAIGSAAFLPLLQAFRKALTPPR